MGYAHWLPNIPLQSESREKLLEKLTEQSESFSGGYILQAMRLALQWQLILSILKKVN
ncbi:MAG: hypothetical protein U1F13_06450 [Acinetobacter parvus]